jgi:REP element-mobilizing transposase RayT
MNKLNKRKNYRLSGYDYSKAGHYFLTLCVKDKQPLLSKISVVGEQCNPQRAGNRLMLSYIGEIIEAEIKQVSNIYKQVTVDKYIIMPNHIHMILIIDSCDKNGRTKFAPTAIYTETNDPLTISRIIKQFKGSITKKIGKSIWQKSFYDHVIRNEQAYLEVCKYIEENPIRWKEDEYYVDK